MFTGLVQALGIVLASTPTPNGRRLTVSLSELVDAKIEEGDSIAVSGVCLTVARRSNGNVQFDVITETLNRTTLGKKIPQDRVNLELSLRPDSYLGGHFVQGHIDARATVKHIHPDPADYRITFQLDADSAPAFVNLIPKGSVAVDGVSMTIAEIHAPAGGGGVGGDGPTFTLAIIPTTLERTTLSALAVGDPVNLETDMLTRTVIHWLTAQWSGRLPAEGPHGMLISKLQALSV